MLSCFTCNVIMLYLTSDRKVLTQKRYEMLFFSEVSIINFVFIPIITIIGILSNLAILYTLICKKHKELKIVRHHSKNRNFSVQVDFFHTTVKLVCNDPPRCWQVVISSGLTLQSNSLIFNKLRGTIKKCPL